MDTQALKSIIQDVSPLQDSQETVEHLAKRLIGEYLPALALAPSKEARDRVWFAFWNYLTSRPAPRKPFALSPQEADNLIEKLQSHLAKETPQ